uniref:ribosomal protein S4 n=1 Tax=Prototheca moriformis TaxID=183676 RepID=UPI003002D050
MLTIHRRIFKHIVRLGNIPGLATITIQSLKRKKKNFFLFKRKRHQHLKMAQKFNPSFNLDQNIKYHYLYRKLRSVFLEHLKILSLKQKKNYSLRFKSYYNNKEQIKKFKINQRRNNFKYVKRNVLMRKKFRNKHYERLILNGRLKNPFKFNFDKIEEQYTLYNIYNLFIKRKMSFSLNTTNERERHSAKHIMRIRKLKFFKKLYSQALLPFLLYIFNVISENHLNEKNIRLKLVKDSINSFYKNNNTYAILNSFTKDLYQLKERQRVKYNYGLKNYQLSNYVYKSLKSNNKTTDNKLLKILHSRLDSIVFLYGISLTIKQARQLILHKHILVNNNIINRPNFLCKEGDLISVNIKSLKKTKIFGKIKLNRQILPIKYNFYRILQRNFNNYLEIDNRSILEYYSK